jgi:hypothetical protein
MSPLQFSRLALNTAEGRTELAERLKTIGA